MMKQTLGRDHQAVIYRKDIELFALRKANEQKENHIKDREVSFPIRRKVCVTASFQIASCYQFCLVVLQTLRYLLTYEIRLS